MLDLNAVIAGMEQMLRRVIGEDIELTTALGADLWRTMADPGQIEQVLVNLAVNARDAMPRGGRLTLETANVDARRDVRQRLRHRPAPAGRYVMLAVTDTGVGMDADTAGAALRAVLHDQGARQGNGARACRRSTASSSRAAADLGLQRARRGHDVQDLPAARARSRSTTREPPAVPLAAARTGSETVLLVEDEAERAASRRERLLRIAGLRGHSRPRARPRPSPRPGHRGNDRPPRDRRDHARDERPGDGALLAAERPGMRVLYMSGYTDAAIAQQGILDAGTAFLSKPFTGRLGAQGPRGPERPARRSLRRPGVDSPSGNPPGSGGGSKRWLDGGTTRRSVPSSRRRARWHG